MNDVSKMMKFVGFCVVRYPLLENNIVLKNQITPEKLLHEIIFFDIMVLTVILKGGEKIVFCCKATIKALNQK